MRKRLVNMAVIVLGIVLLLNSTSQAFAAGNGKKAVYSTVLNSAEMNLDTIVSTDVTNIAISGNTFIIKGSLLKAKTEYGSTTGLYTSSVKQLKYKTRQFKISKNCKYQFQTDDDGLISFSQSEFMEYLPSYAGIGLRFFTNKKGKIYRFKFQP